MKSMRWMGVLAVVLAMAASGCSEDTSSGGCAIATDCPDGSTCYQGACTAVCSLGSCPEGQVCHPFEGVCVPICSSELDCGLNEQCQNGACVSVCMDLGQNCNIQADCCSGTCGADGFCEEAAGCSTNADCPNGICDLKTGTCAPHESCDTVECPIGEICDSVTFTCGPNDGPVGGLGDCAVCATDDDCSGAPYACLPFGGGSYCLSTCASHNDCISGFKCFTPPGASDQLCIPGGYSCEKPCLQAGCPAGQTCDTASGECVAQLEICDVCIKDDECGYGARCAVVGNNKVCVPECLTGGACASGGTCTSVQGVDVCMPAGSVCCFGEGCPSGCQSSQDCGGLTPVCDTLTGECVECSNSSQCPGGGFCNTETNTCEENTSDCNPPCEGLFALCNPATLTCVQCITDADCAADEFCSPANNTCTTDICEMCQSPYPACTQINGEWACVQCVVDSDCPSGDCDEATYFCLGGPAGGGTAPASCTCNSDEDCQAGGQFNLKCDTSVGICYDLSGGCDGIAACCDYASGSECVSIFDLFGGGGLPGGLPGLPGGAFGFCSCSLLGDLGGLGGLGGLFGGGGGGESAGNCLGGAQCSPMGLFLSLLGGSQDPNAEFSDSSFCQ